MKLAIIASLAIAAPAFADDLYVLAGNAFPTLLKLDPATGGVLESHAVTGQEALFGGLAANASGNLFSIDGYNDELSDRLFAIDKATGAGSIIGATRFNWNFRCVCVNPANGTLYGVTDNNLYTMDTSTGEATPVASVTGPPELDQLTAIAISSSGQAFITDIGNTDLFSLDLVTGVATRIASIGDTGNWFNDLAFDSAGMLHGPRSNGGVFIIDTATGALTSQFAGLFTGMVYVATSAPCYANCDLSTAPPTLNANDFQCFLNKFAAQDPGANCDNSTAAPVLNANDFQCFLNLFAAGCP